MINERVIDINRYIFILFFLRNASLISEKCFGDPFSLSCTFFNKKFVFNSPHYNIRCHVSIGLLDRTSSIYLWKCSIGIFCFSRDNKNHQKKRRSWVSFSSTFLMRIFTAKGLTIDVYLKINMDGKCNKWIIVFSISNISHRCKKKKRKKIFLSLEYLFNILKKWSIN